VIVVEQVKLHYIGVALTALTDCSTPWTTLAIVIVRGQRQLNLDLSEKMQFFDGK
jgi:hypothetical protein